MYVSNHYVCHLLITVPPKGVKRNQNRHQPYQTAVRKSARKVTHRFIGTRAQPDNPVEGDGQPDAPAPEPAKKQSQGRPKQRTEQVQTQPQVNPQPINITDDQPAVAQQQEGVTRLEFQTLQASMNSIRDMFNSLVNKLSPSDNVSQTPPSTEVNKQGQGGLNQPITTQPTSVVRSDINIGPTQPTTQSNDVVNQAIAAHISSIVGPQIPGNNSEAVSYQLDRKVPDNIIQDIWDEKFIDFNCLLDKCDDSEQGLIIKYSQPGEPLTLVPPKGKSQISCIKQWSQAFDIFHSVYSRKYPHQTHNLLTYAATVKDLAAQGGDYLRYDQEFRRARMRYGIPWEVPENIMWTTCSQSGIKNHVNQVLAGLVAASPQPFFSDLTPLPQSPHPFHGTFLDSMPTKDTPTPTPQPTPNNKQLQLPQPPNPRHNKDPITHDDTKLKHPGGFCYTFHNKGTCNKEKCPYIHACWVPGCGKEHSVYVCPHLAKHFNIPVRDNPGPKALPAPPPKSTTNTDRSQ